MACAVYCKAGQAIDHNKIRHICFAYWITKATRARAHTNTEYVILFVQGNNGYANAPQCYVYTYVAYLVWEWCCSKNTL
jgi:hypothetical protein